MKIPLSKPVITKEMVKAATEAMQNEHFTMGESVFRFEEEFARYVGTDYAISTNSGTSALQLSIIAMDMKPRDQIITTPFSFISTANAIVQAGSIPIFADIDRGNYNIDPKVIVEKITESTKAILPVHLFGFPADMDGLDAIAREHDLLLIEDACQAHGATYKGRKIGGLGDVGCFSFYPSKNMTVFGDGGMVTTNHERIAKSIAKLRDCGRISKYEHDVVGYTARLNTVNAAVGRIQLRHLDEWNDTRTRVAMLYRRLLSDIDELTLPPEPQELCKPVYHLYVIRTKSRDRLKSFLEKAGIECGVHYPIPIHLQPIYRKLFGLEDGANPVSEQCSREVLSIPVFPEMIEDEVRYVCEKIHEFF